MPFPVFELKCILNLLLRASMCVSECVFIRKCPWIYVLLCTCVYDCVCERASLSLPTFMSTGNYLRICLWHYVRELMFANVRGCEQACLWTSMSANVCIFDRACQRTYMSANVCECVCKRVRLRTCLWSVNSAFSFSLPAAPAAIRAWGLSRESLVIIFASPGVRHLASGSAGCPITQGSLRTSDMMNHKYLRVGIG